MNNKGTKTLETDRLILRRFSIEDALAFYETVGFKTYSRYMELTDL